MDCARAASRLPNVQSVSLVYRREVREMPADEEEIQLVLAEDIPILSLLSPVSLTDGELTCQVMKMGERDETGRKPFIATDETRVLPATTVISAIGEAVDGKFFNELGIEVDDRGCPVLDAKTNETNLPGVFVIGDASFGPATIVEAIADATRACSKITRIHNSNYKKLNVNPDNQAPLLKRGILSTPDQPLAAASSCLECQTVCEACVDACPNRANVVVELADKPQIVHIEQMCNDCGNCETFCPYSSAPYQEKMTLFHSAEAFSQSDNQGFFVEDCAQKLVQVRMNGKVVSVDLNEKRVPIGRPVAQLINTVMEQYDYYLVK
jgi:putative selenate reductase